MNGEGISGGAGREPDPILREKLVGLVDSPTMKTLIEVRAEETVRDVVSRWRTRTVFLLTAIASILAILGINLKDKFTDLNQELSQRQDDIRRLDSHIARIQKDVSVAADALQREKEFVKAITTQVSAILTTTQGTQNAAMQSFLDTERQLTQNELTRFTNQVATEITRLDESKILLQKAMSDANSATSAAGLATQQTKDTNQKAQAALRELESLPTVTFVMLRRDIPFAGQLPPSGPRVKIRLIHTRTGKEQNHADMTFEVNGKGLQPHTLYEHHPERLEGTDYQMELLFAYDFPVFGKDVDFVMLKFWRSP